MNPYPYSTVQVAWKAAPNIGADCIPENSFVACMLETGEIAYVAKSHLDHQIVTGMTTNSAGYAYIPYGSVEHQVKDYEVLTTDDPQAFHWVRDKNGNVPQAAVPGGHDRKETLFIGRTCTKLSNSRTWDGQQISIRDVDGAKRLGKIHCSHGCLYVPYNGKEYIFPKYEVLCFKKSPASLKKLCRWEIIQTLHGVYHSKKSILEAIKKLPLPPPVYVGLQKDVVDLSASRLV